MLLDDREQQFALAPWPGLSDAAVLHQLDAFVE
jgi:hypothetical protein